MIEATPATKSGRTVISISLLSTVHTNPLRVLFATLLNVDDSVNILDVILLVNIVLGNQLDSILADMNNDGQTNILDVIILVNLIISP